MAKNQKRTSGLNAKREKQTRFEKSSTDNDLMLWDFSNVDADDCFKFDPYREDFEAKEIFSKVIYFSQRTWSELKKDTHDRGKSKHHFLADAVLSNEAERRISKLRLEERRDQIFSIRLTNTIRIIGLREGARFVVKWFDPEHKFCPSSKK